MINNVGIGFVIKILINLTYLYKKNKIFFFRSYSLKMSCLIILISILGRFIMDEKPMQVHMNSSVNGSATNLFKGLSIQDHQERGLLGIE